MHEDCCYSMWNKGYLEQLAEPAATTTHPYQQKMYKKMDMK